MGCNVFTSPGNYANDRYDCYDFLEDGRTLNYILNIYVFTFHSYIFLSFFFLLCNFYSLSTFVIYKISFVWYLKMFNK
jgi:hypothetical protein